MTCDRCSELEARVEALLDELHDTRTRLNDVVRERGIEQAVTRRHPSAVGLSDPCPPFGIRRPDLRLIGGTG